jgi:phage-related tail fiber protein
MNLPMAIGSKKGTVATLFAAIGTTFGAGDGSTTFLVPDLRGEFMRGWDDGRGVDSSRTFGSAQGEAFASHAHGVNDPGHAHGYNEFAAGNGGGFRTSGGDYYSGNQGAGTAGAGTGISIQTSGGTETRPRNVALLACIKF